jgi:DNA-binding response OmpR family regulator
VPEIAGITKPFHYPQLLARIGAVLKRVSRARDAHRLTYGEPVVNELSREVTGAGMRVEVCT